MDLLEMATNKKAVTVYLDNEVLEYVEKYCTEYGVIGKDKEGNIIPRLGTGIHELLKQLLNTPINELTEPLKKHNDSTVLSTLDSTVLYAMNERLTKLESVVYSQDNISIVLDKIVNDSIETVMDLVDTGKVNDLSDIVSDSEDKVMDSDNSAIQSRDLIGVENIESGLIDSILTAVKQKEDITAESTLSESPNLPVIEVSPHNVPEGEIKAVNGEIPTNEDKLTEEKIIELLKKHKIPTVKDSPLIIVNNELLYPFLSELLGKKVDIKSLSKVANKDKHYLASATLWNFLSVKKVSGKWQWTRIK